MKKFIPNFKDDNVSNKKVDKRGLEKLMAGAVAAAGIGSIATETDALSFTGAQINPNFTMDGNYMDNFGLFTVNYNGPFDADFYGNSLDLLGIHYGGNLGITNPGWNLASDTNSDGSTNYHLTSLSSFVDIKLGSPLQFQIDWAAEGANLVPTGIGSQSLDFSNQADVGYAGGEISTGYIPTPDATHNGPAIVPEPASIILMGAGIGALALKQKVYEPIKRMLSK